MGVKKNVGVIFEYLEREFGQLGLDFENCIAFGYNGCLTIVGHQLKKKILFIL